MERPKERAKGEEESHDEMPLFPIRKVVFSKTGIGYFERADRVNGSSTFELFFKSSDMNDVLKSLTMVDLEGGAVSSVSYESTQPFQKQLEELSISLNEDSKLKDLIQQVKGTEIQLTLDDATQVTGVVIGLEKASAQHINKKSGESEEYTVRYLNLLVDGESIQFVDLAKVRKITFLNELLQNDLRHLLGILLQAKKKDLKSVTAFTKGTGERTVVASYIVEAPVWKTSFRLLLPSGAKTEKKKEGGKALFQGWALVDNTQNEDWMNVSLSIVGGTSNSFVYDLYNARYVKRTEVEVKEEATLAPPVLEDSVVVHDAAALKTADSIAKEQQREKMVRAKALELDESEEEEDDEDNWDGDFAEEKQKSLSPSMSFNSMPPPPPAPGAAAPMRSLMMMDMKADYSEKKEKRRETSSRIKGKKMREEKEEEYYSPRKPVPPQPKSALSLLAKNALLGTQDQSLSFGGGGGEGGPTLDQDEEIADYSMSNAMESVEVHAEGKKSETADLFQYKITNPVCVKRNQSALVPFLQDEFLGKKVAIYNKNVRTKNPLAVILFKNTFGVPLEGGPMSIFEDEVYVGEAMLPDIKPKQEAFVAYAVELRVDVTEQEDQELREVYKVELGLDEYVDKGILKLHKDRVKKLIYIIDNKNDFDVDLYIEHPKKLNHSLIETAAPEQVTEHFLRFRVNVPSKEVVKFVVSESIPEIERHDLREMKEQDVKTWSKKKYLNKELKKACKQMIKFLKHLDEMEFEKKLLELKIDELRSDVDRIKYIQSVLDNGNKGFLGLGATGKCKNFFTGELNSTLKALRPKEKEFEEIEKAIKEEEEEKRKWIEGLKFSATIDLATNKVEHKFCIVLPVPKSDKEDPKSPKKGKGKKKEKGN